MTGYKPSLISTIVDTHQDGDRHNRGYKPSLISTIVDSGWQRHDRLGYKPSLISTIVDMLVV